MTAYNSRLDAIRKLVSSAQNARSELWKLAIPNRHSIGDGCIRIPIVDFEHWRGTLERPVNVERLREHHLIESDGDSQLVHLKLLGLYGILRPFFRDLFEPTKLGLQRDRLLADVAFVVRQSIKSRYQFVHSPIAYHLLRCATEGLERAKAEFGWCEAGLLDPNLQDQVRRSIDSYLGQLSGVEPHGKPQVDSSSFLDFFLEHCYSLEETDLGSGADGLRMPVGWLDVNFLASRLFGMRTAIPSLDVLFEGGLSLSDPVANPIAPSRMLLLRGQFGAGKSVLALMLAAEVVRKGGVVSYVSLDNSLDALRGYLSAFDLIDEPICEDDGEGEVTLSDRRGSRGGLRLYYPPNSRRSLTELLSQIKKHIDFEIGEEKGSQEHRLRLLVIDPINSVQSDLIDANDVRSQIIETFSSVRERAGNILLVAEASEPGGSHQAALHSAWSNILPYVADTVIDITSLTLHGYEQRYAQVSKSRFQRERRGRHPLAIVPGRGIYVAPASSAFSSELSMVRPIEASAPQLPPASTKQSSKGQFVSFGQPDVDRILGERAIRRADTIVFRGPDGCLKTLLGLHFLSAERHGGSFYRKASRSILFMQSAQRAKREFLDSFRSMLPSVGKPIRLASLPIGFVQPGRILQNIQAEFERARDDGIAFDRVLVGDVGRWDFLCPFVRDDPGFGRALLDLFRAEGATVAFVCAERKKEADSLLQRTIVDATSIVFDFERVEFGGAQRVLMRATRSSGSLRNDDWHEVAIQQQKLHIDPSLLRVFEKGADRPPLAAPISTTLHLFEVGGVQEKYHAAIRRRLRGVLNTPVSVRKVDRPELADAAQLGHLSIGSNLSIVQVDEHQLPALKLTAEGRSMLQGFPIKLLERWTDPAVRRCVILNEPGGSDGQSVVALPYYRNLGLLTEREDLLKDDSIFSDWLRLCEYGETHSFEVPFFDFAKKPEDYNCLFFEIAQSLDEMRRRGRASTSRPFAVGGEAGHDDLVATTVPEGGEISGFPGCAVDEEDSKSRLFGWIGGQPFEEALSLFYRLCAPSHRNCRMGTEESEAKLNPAPWDSVVSRQWYTSLLFCLWSDRDRSQKLAVRTLPSRIALSGEWYLGLWAHSAVPEIGLNLIENLTSARAQTERLQAGIGLPTFDELCKDDRELFPGTNVRLENLRIGELLRGATRRSSIYRYDIVAPIIAEKLRNFLNAESLSGGIVKSTVEVIQRDLNQALR